MIAEKTMICTKKSLEAMKAGGSIQSYQTLMTVRARVSVSAVWHNFSRLTAGIAFLGFQHRGAKDVQTDFDARE